MNLAEVMQEVADRIDTVTGLRTFGYPPDSIQPPAAVVTYPEEYRYDETMRRGMDRITLPVVVMVGKASDRASRDRIGPYLDGSGDKSLKQVIESGTYTAFHSVRVTGATFDIVQMASVEYLAATLSLDIAGTGA